LIAGYDQDSKTDITVLKKGMGGLDECVLALPQGKAVFGGIRTRGQRFNTFFYCDSEGTTPMQKGRASLHKNGELLIVAF